jgi:hypothetical protein
MQVNLGIVIKADGKVPFDPDLHPDHRRAIIGHLSDLGHTLEPAEDGSHVRIVSGPLKPATAS